MKKTLLAIALVSSMMCSAALAAPVLWVGDQFGRLGTVDVATPQTVNVIGDMGYVMTDIAFDNQGNLYGITFTQLFSIDTTTAQATLIGNTNLSTLNSLVFDANNNLYAASNILYTLNVTTGAATAVGNNGTAYSSTGDLAFIAGELFLSSRTTGFDSLVKLDTSNGAASLIGNIGYRNVYGLATNNNSDLYGISGRDVLSINTTTGAGTFLFNYGGQGLFDAYGSAFYQEAGATIPGPDPVPVPEPGTLLLLGSGLAGLALYRRRMNKS